eukprot:c53464_g1_i1 orf=77-556(+)
MRSHIVELTVDRDPVVKTLSHFMRFPEELQTMMNAPALDYVQDSKAMAGTAVDIKESKTEYTFYADMPGLSRSEIEVQLEEDNILSIRGKRKREEITEESAKYVRMERRSAKFLRKFSLPADANSEGISATCQDGVLTVKVPKLPPEPKKPQTIQIQVT